MEAPVLIVWVDIVIKSSWRKEIRPPYQGNQDISIHKHTQYAWQDPQTIPK